MLRSLGSGTGVDGRSLGFTCFVADFEFFFGWPRFPFLNWDSLEEGMVTGLRPSPIPTVEPTMDCGAARLRGSFCATLGCARGVTGPLGAGPPSLPGEGLLRGPGVDTSANMAPMVGSGS